MNTDRRPQRYVITSFNRLTGEDCIISSPMEKKKALELMERQKRKNHRGSFWSKLKVVPACQEGNLF